MNREPSGRISFLLNTLCLIVVSIMFMGEASPQTQQKLRQSKLQLEKEIEYTNTLLDQTKKTKQSSLNRLKLLNKQIERREALISTISKEIGSVEVEIATDNLMISKLSRDLQMLQNEYAQMIYYAYRTMKGNDRLTFIFSAKDFNQAFNRLRYYQEYASYRRIQAEKIIRTQTELARRRTELEDVKSHKITLAQSQENEKRKLTREKQEKDKAVKELTNKEKELLATLRVKQTALNKLQIEIEKVVASAGKRTSPSGSKTGTPATLSPSEMKLSSSFAANKGLLPWPTEKGVVVSTFGEHAHPVLKYVKVKNNGVDIMVENGSSVKAVFNGKVSRVLSVPNLNNVVIIRHGEYLTVYSNLGEVSVKDGQEVTTRETIGKIHTDPDDGKSELHFEIWLGKSIQDPQDWLNN
jgi:septal ring factor EnvC (AmiA/AmiB activator)